jgi:hypothetical protein
MNEDSDGTVALFTNDEEKLEQRTLTEFQFEEVIEVWF